MSSAQYIGGLIAPNGPPTANTPQTVQLTGSPPQYTITPANSVVTPGSFPYTVVATDTLVLASAASGTVAVDLPAAASFPGRVLDVLKTDSTNNVVSIVPNGTDTIQGVNVALSLNTPQQSVTLQSISAGWVVI